MAEAPPKQDRGIPLGDIALDVVRRGPDGGEKYIIHPKGPELITVAVRAVLLSGELPEVMAGRFRAVIAVCWVLDEREGSPAAARVLADALFSDPRVAEVLGLRLQDDRGRERAYRKFLDDKDARRAPKLGDRAPEDALRVTSFLSPGQQDMTSRVRQAAAKRQQLDAQGGVRAGRRPPAAGASGPAPRRRPVVTSAPTEDAEAPKPVRRPPPGSRKV